MKQPAIGPVHERITAITNVSYPLYVVRGDERDLLIDSGVNMLGPRYLAELTTMFPETSRPGQLFLTHSHWDHVGSADYLRRHLSGLRIGAHERTAAVVRKPSAIETMNRLSLDEIGLLRDGEVFEDVALHPFEIDILLKHGDEFDLGGLTCRVYETPGHTRDSLAYYFPEIEALFPGDASGVLLRRPDGKIQVEFVASYDAYVRSLKLMTALEPKVVCLAHNCVLTHQEAAEFLQRSLAETHRYRELIESCLRAADGNIQETIQEIARVDFGSETGPRRPPAAYLTNVTAQVKHIAEHPRIARHPRHRGANFSDSELMQ